MTALEMKWKIVQIMDKVEEKTLIEVLQLLEAAAKPKQQIDYDISTNMEQILEENKDLLKRLA